VASGYVVMPPAILSQITNLIPSLNHSDHEYELTKREKEIIQLVVNGHSTQQIADKLFVSYHTVDNHLRNIYQKLNVKKRTNLVSLVLQRQII